jgi:hypothetical protein
VQSIALDGSENVYATGFSYNSWKGDGGADPKHAFSSPSGGVEELFVLKLSKIGVYQWHTFYGSSTGADYGNGIALDGSANVYVTGYSCLIWLGDAKQSPKHAFSDGCNLLVLKLNSSGVYQWHTFYGSTGFNPANAIAATQNGTLFVTGYSNAAWLGSGSANPLHAYTGGDDLFVLSLDKNGVYQWHTFYGSNSHDEGAGLALEGNWNLYITGQSYATWLGGQSAHLLHPYTDGADLLAIKLRLKYPSFIPRLNK